MGYTATFIATNPEFLFCRICVNRVVLDTQVKTTICIVCNRELPRAAIMSLKERDTMYSDAKIAQLEEQRRERTERAKERRIALLEQSRQETVAHDLEVEEFVNKRVEYNEQVDAPIGCYFEPGDSHNLHRQQDQIEWGRLDYSDKARLIAHCQVNDALRLLTQNVKNTQAFARCIFDVVLSLQKTLLTHKEENKDISVCVGIQRERYRVDKDASRKLVKEYCTTHAIKASCQSIVTQTGPQ